MAAAIRLDFLCAPIHPPTIKQLSSRISRKNGTGRWPISFPAARSADPIRDDDRLILSHRSENDPSDIRLTATPEKLARVGA
jgi:hypothetical protein